MRKLPPLNAVRAFEAAGRLGSFTRAAAELHVTHGAVSRQVALLEKWLGNTMFHRASSRLTLTRAGRIYLREVTATLDRLAAATVYARECMALMPLRVNAPPTFAMRWLIPRISNFQRRRPDVEVRLTTSVEAVNFPDNGYDVAIRGADAAPAGSRSTPFMDEHIVPVCHPRLLRSKPIRRPGDLRSHTLISYTTEPCSWAQWLQEAQCSRLRPGGRLNFEQMFFALQAASEGLGIALVPLFLVIDEIVAERLCAPLRPSGTRRRSYLAMSPLSEARSALHDSFCGWLVEEGHHTQQLMEQWAASQGWPS
jgi:LysR family transcriptional regulator, glycine cleavage system transcriptional activator